MKKKKIQILPQAIVSLAKEIVSQTPDGDVGYGEACDRVMEIWGAFTEAGATVSDIERINGFLRWSKHEGFCDRCPMK